MKVAIVVPYFTPYVRGNEFGLADGLSRLGADVTILTSKGKAPREKMVTKKTDTRQELCFKVKYLPTVLDAGEIPLTPTVFTEVLNGGYDVLLLQEDYQPICHIAYIAARLKKIPTVLSTERTYFPDSNKRLILGFFDATFNKMLRQGTTVYTSHCTAARDFIQRELGVPEGRVKVIPVGVDTGLFKPISGHTPLNEGDFKILTISRLHQYKGLEYLIKAMDIVRKERPGAILYIMGRGPLEKDLKDMVRSSGLIDSVRFIETPVPNYEMPRVYSSADLYCQPSIVEPYGIAVVEAMACGKPVLCSRVGGMMDTVKDGETGYLVEKENPGALAEKILLLSSDPRMLSRMSESSRKRAVKNFDWAVISSTYLNIIESIVRK